MYQENSQRKWQTSSVTQQPPMDNLKTFLQKRIRAIMAKEWWDFIVNVNTLNSDHASLLYSLANLCPSFNYFLQSRDKELQLIIKKRPVVKPRIFSGTERSDTTPEPIVPKQLPLVTRRNSANELVKILNELYPNENSKSKQPRSYGPKPGPASKQKKSPPGGPAKNSISGEVTKQGPLHNTPGRSPLLKRLLADESQKENAHITNIKKFPQHLSMPIIIEDDEPYPKAVLSHNNYDLNQNRLNQPSPRKMKKIVKVKKKRYIYSNTLGDPKNRTKYILEDETPNLSLKLIKKYRIKKCTVNLVRLKDYVLEYYEELKRKKSEKLLLSLEESSSLVPNEESKSSSSEITDKLNNVSNVDSTSPPVDLPSEKGEDNSEKNISNLGKENTPIVETLNPKELKNMYCHGGIVPLGKLLMSDKMGSNNKHFLSLKEKKIRDISNDVAIFSKPKDVNSKMENSELGTKTVTSNNTPDLDKLDSFESRAKENPVDNMESDRLDKCNDKAVLDDNIISNGAAKESETVQCIPIEEIRKSPISELENSNIPFNAESVTTTDSESVDTDDSLIINTSGSSCDENMSNVSNETAEPTLTNSNGNVALVSSTINDEVPIINGDKVLDTNDMDIAIPCEMSDQVEKSNKTIPVIEKSTCANGKLEAINDSLAQTLDGKQALEKIISDTLSNGSEESEPLAKRPRIEINLSEMKVVASENSAELVCNMCKSTFECVESWDEHFVNKVPKCTPNLQVTWDNPETSLLTD